MGQEKASTAQPKIMSADNTEEFGNEIWDENLGNQSNDLEHTCCGKFCFIYVTSRYNAKQKRFL